MTHTDPPDTATLAALHGAALDLRHQRAVPHDRLHLHTLIGPSLTVTWPNGHPRVRATPAPSGDTWRVTRHDHTGSPTGEVRGITHAALSGVVRTRFDHTDPTERDTAEAARPRPPLGRNFVPLAVDMAVDLARIVAANTPDRRLTFEDLTDLETAAKALDRVATRLPAPLTDRPHTSTSGLAFPGSPRHGYQAISGAIYPRADGPGEALLPLARVPGLPEHARSFDLSDVLAGSLNPYALADLPDDNDDESAARQAAHEEHAGPRDADVRVAEMIADPNGYVRRVREDRARRTR